MIILSDIGSHALHKRSDFALLNESMVESNITSNVIMFLSIDNSSSKDIQ